MTGNRSGAPNRVLIVAIAALIGALVGTALLYALSPRTPVMRVDDTPVEIGGPFTLTAHTGEEVSDADFRGRPLLVYFGFTYCPDVCPLSLQSLARALEELGPDAEAFQPLLVTVDPQRDTPEALAVYVASNGFPDNLIGLTGTEEEIRALADAYLVEYFVLEDEDSYAEYLMEHTSIIYLMDENGDFVRPFTHTIDSGEIAEGLRRYLAQRDADA